MAAKYICDGCGIEEPAGKSARGWTKPWDWFQRMDEDGVQDACSRICIDRIAKATAKSGTALPL